MINDSTEFYNLLNLIAEEQTFPLELSPRDASGITTVPCKPLSTSHLKKLIETVIDNPLTQSLFNTTVTQIFNQSLTAPVSDLNTIDRLLFILESRSQTLSPTITLKEDGKEISVNLKEISNKIKQQLREHSSYVIPSTASEGKIAIKFGVPLLSTELQLNEEFPSNSTPNLEDVDELRELLGETFINEIAKSIHSITIEDKVLDLSTATFKARLKLIETLPASLIQSAIDYIERYKKVVDDCLLVEGHTISIDGTLFSNR